MTKIQLCSMLKKKDERGYYFCPFEQSFSVDKPPETFIQMNTDTGQPDSDGKVDSEAAATVESIVAQIKD